MAVAVFEQWWYVNMVDAHKDDTACG